MGVRHAGVAGTESPCRVRMGGEAQGRSARSASDGCLQEKHLQSHRPGCRRAWVRRGAGNAGVGRRSWVGHSGSGETQEAADARSEMHENDWEGMESRTAGAERSPLHVQDVGHGLYGWEGEAVAGGQMSMLEDGSWR